MDRVLSTILGIAIGCAFTLSGSRKRKPRYAMMTSNDSRNITLRLTKHFKTSRDKAFDAWTDAQALSRWFGPTDEFQTRVLDLDVRVGGIYRFELLSPEGTIHTVSGEYRVIAPPEKLVFTWAWEPVDEQTNTLVTIDFFERGNETELVLTHEYLVDEDSRDKHEIGWNGCLKCLRRLVAE